jgi:hypothetical protein
MLSVAVTSIEVAEKVLAHAGFSSIFSTDDAEWSGTVGHFENRMLIGAAV